MVFESFPTANKPKEPEATVEKPPQEAVVNVESATESDSTSLSLELKEARLEDLSDSLGRLLSRCNRAEIIEPDSLGKLRTGHNDLGALISRGNVHPDELSKTFSLLERGIREIDNNRRKRPNRDDLEDLKGIPKALVDVQDESKNAFNRLKHSDNTQINEALSSLAKLGDTAEQKIYTMHKIIQLVDNLVH